MKDKLVFALDCLTNPVGPHQEHRQTRLLASILIFVILFSIATLLLMLIFSPRRNPSFLQYEILIISVVFFSTIVYILNCIGYYKISAMLLVTIATFAPWISLLFDPTIITGDFVPLTYLIFSILLSSLLLPTYITIIFAVLQITGLVLVLMLSPATQLFNWFSFLTFIVLTSVFSILVNSIIQRNMNQIASQAHRLALNEPHLQELSVRDHLTTLFNRRYLEETLEREIHRAVRTQHPLGVIMLDVDHFKRINDTLGHAAGDIVLQELGKFLAGQIRQSDFACRYGGDEFVLVLPDAARNVTMERAEHLREGVQHLSISPEYQITITISQGLAVFPDDGSTVETILRSADTALYRAKHDRSNLVVMAG